MAGERISPALRIENGGWKRYTNKLSKKIRKRRERGLMLSIQESALTVLELFLIAALGYCVGAVQSAGHRPWQLCHFFGGAGVRPLRRLVSRGAADYRHGAVHHLRGRQRRAQFCGEPAPPRGGVCAAVPFYRGQRFAGVRGGDPSGRGGDAPGHGADDGRVHHLAGLCLRQGGLPRQRGGRGPW